MEINAHTKVGALLAAHPELEEPLIEWVPAFAKLRNPILRATVAKVASLEQAARVGGVPLPRSHTVPSPMRLGLEEGPGKEAAPSRTVEVWPDWFHPEKVVATLDAAALLQEGGHPLAQVKKALAAHPAGSIVVLNSDFEPAPLLDQLSREGFQVTCIHNGGAFRTAIRRN